VDIGAIRGVATAITDYLDTFDLTSETPTALPTLRGLLDTINTALNDALAEALAGTPVTLTISAGLDTDSPAIRFDIALDVSKTIQTGVDLGGGLAALGLDPDLGGSLQISLTVGLSLSFSFGIDLGSMIAGNAPTANDFFIRLHRAQATLVAALDIDGISVAMDLGAAQGTLSIDGGHIQIDGSVNLGITDPNADGKLTFAELADIGSLLQLEPHATLEVILPISGTVTGNDFELGGTFTLVLKPFDVFSGTAPEFGLFLSGHVSVGGFFYISGDFGFGTSSGTASLVNVNTLADAGTREVSVITIGGENLHAFVGVNGPYEIGGDPTQINPAAMGLSISGVDFAIALAKPKATPTDPVGADLRSWFALEAHADDFRIVGVDELTAAISNLSVAINQGGGTKDGQANTTVLKLSSLGTGGLEVPTGVARSIKLDLDVPVLRASADISLNVAGFFIVNGTFGFEKTTKQLTITDGTNSSTIAASVLTVGASGASAFVGVNGPYFQDTDENGVIDDNDTPNDKAIGLALEGISFALALARPTATAPPSATSTDKRSWVALKAHADFAGLVGITGLTANATSIDVSINRGNGTNNGTTNTTVVNFSGLETNTGLTVPGTSLKLDFAGKLLEGCHRGGDRACSGGMFVQTILYQGREHRPAESVEG
jgi:hypothetical protein